MRSISVVACTMFLCLLCLASACLFPSLDGFASDASVEVATDSSSDASTDTGDARGPFCPQDGAVLCSDFDESDASFLGLWDFAYSPGTTTMQVSTAFSSSPPQSLLVATTSTDQSAGLSKSESFAQGIQLSFDVYIVALGGNPSICSFSLGNASLILLPQVGSTSVLEATQLADGGTDYAGTTGPGSAQLGTWIHVDFDFDHATHTATATFDGTLAAKRVATNAAWSLATSMTLALGVASSSNETLYYDNVTIKPR